MRLLLQLGDEGTLLALLLCGHCLGDFVFQSAEMVRRKGEARWLAYHALVVTLLHAVLLVPFLSWPAAAAAAGLGLAHGLVDRFKVLLGRRGMHPLAAFWLDQLLHLASLLLAWRLLVLWQPPPLPALQGSLPALTLIAVAVAAYAFNYNGAAAVVGMLLESYKLPSPDADDDLFQRTLRMGRTIGILERALALTLVLVDQWGALGLILAAKSIARFKDLEKRSFGEYYLIGTLASILLVVLSGLVVKVLV